LAGVEIDIFARKIGAQRVKRFINRVEPGNFLSRRDADQAIAVTRRNDVGKRHRQAADGKKSHEDSLKHGRPLAWLFSFASVQSALMMLRGKLQCFPNCTLRSSSRIKAKPFWFDKHNWDDELQ